MGVYAYILLLLLTEKVSLLLTLECECGYTKGVTHRIFGGIDASCEFPWIVYISRNNKIYCGGSLINNLYVITAGHCVKWTSTQTLRLIIGKNETKKGNEIVRSISEAIIHPNFISDRVHDNNDIALLKLNEVVNFTKNVYPICLPNPLSDYSYHMAIVAGWGITKEEAYPEHVLKAFVQVLPDEKCLRTSLRKHFTDNNICAYADDVDACQGDSGGPLMFERHDNRLELIGIVSWGISCAKKNMPGIYTKMANYLKWIEENTKDAKYCTAK